jgi:hypothetical protein
MRTLVLLTAWALLLVACGEATPPAAPGPTGSTAPTEDMGAPTGAPEPADQEPMVYDLAIEGMT